MVTGPRGEVLTDLFESRTGPSESELQAVISAVEKGRTDRGGSLLGSFNIGYVVLQRGPGAYRWLSQADLAVARDNPDEEHLLLSNQDVLARAGVYEEVPSVVSAIDRKDPALIQGTPPPPRENAEQQGSARYRAELEPGGGVVLLTETYDDRWQARLDGLELERTEAGWANAFELPAGRGGELVLSYPRSGAHTIGLIVLALAWIVVLGGAFSRASGARRARR